MNRVQRQDETEITTRDIARSARKLLRARFFSLLKRFFLHAGLALMVLVSAGAFLAAAALQPELLGVVRSGFRAEALLIFCGIPAILLTGLYVAYLHPRAVIAVYETYAEAQFVAPRGGGSLTSTNRSYVRVKGAYWAAALVWLCGGLAAAGFCWPLTLAAEKIPRFGSFCSSAVLTLGLSLFWLLRVPLGLSLAAAARENIGGFRALRRGFLLHRRVRQTASAVYMPWLIAVVLLGFGALLLSQWASGGEPLRRTVVLAFLLALSLPAWSVLLAAFDTALYAAACRGRRLNGEHDEHDEQNAFQSRRADKNRRIDQRKERISMKTRDQIESTMKWDLGGIYPNEDLWEQDFAAAQELVGAFSAHAGKLHVSDDALYAALTDGSKLSYLVEKLYVYAHMKKDEDNGNVRYQGMTDRAIQMLVAAEAASSFVKPEILAIPHETLVSWSKQERFKHFRFDLFDIDRRREHTLSTEEERLLAMAEDALSGAHNVFTMLSDVDLEYGTVTDENGEEVKLTHGTYGMFLMSPDRRVRRDAYEGLYKAYRSMKNTITATYATSVKADVFRARTHNFSGALEAALFGNGVPVSVYDQLIEAVHEKLPTLHKYLAIRKRLLGVDQLEMYDLYVPILSDLDIPMPYEDAKSLVKEALIPLGEPYGKLLDDSYTKGWIDVYETPGKTSGAFSWGVYGVHPYVLLNYQDKLDDAFTLGHELGHAMHSYYSNSAQPYETSQYRIMVAEVASTVNETLMTYHLLEKETDKMKRAYYITQFLESFRTTCFRQTMFAEFERNSHRMAENGEPLTVESLSEMYRKLNELYYEGAHVDDNIAIEWMRVPHFYNAFYVYQYATGLCSAVKLADDILHHGAVERYLTFLQSGGSDYPIEELKAAGVDLTKKESILASLDVFTQYVDELDELLK